ncbi:MAG: RIP metalloprotease RseP [Candidatus Brocadiales bacterium]
MPSAEVSSNILLVIVGIGSLIFIHELGHFLAAKKIGVRVLIFSLGFGMPLIRRTWGETEYRISLIPLGGYVKLAGEHLEEGAPRESWDFMSKTPAQRGLVLIAGVVMNTLLAFLVFIIAFRIGVPFVTAEIGEVAPGWPAWEAGLQPGDNIVEITGTTDPDFEDIFTAVALGSNEGGVPIKVDRNGEILEFNVLPRYDEVHGLQRIGIAPAMSQKIGRLLRYADDAPALDAGLKVGDKIIAINGEVIKRAEEIIEIEAQSPGKELTLTILRDGEEKEFKVTPLATMRWMMGVSCTTTKIRAVRAGGMAAQMGLRKGDEILTVNDKEVAGWFAVTELIEGTEESPIRLGVKRAEKIEELHLHLESHEDKDRFFTGISPVLGLRVDRVMEDFPAAEIGMKPGDEIIYLDGQTPRSWEDLLRIITTSEGREMTIKWLRDGKTLTGKFQPIKDEKSAIGRMGLQLKEKSLVKQYNLIGACQVGTYKALVMIKRIYLTIKGLFTKKVSTETVGGIILIAQASYESAKLGMGKLLYFMGIISLQLAMLNILPIPVLDGGHLLFLGVEKVKGSPVSERTMAIAQYIGLALILCLLVFATRNDILRFFMTPQ